VKDRKRGEEEEGSRKKSNIANRYFFF